MTYHLPHLNWIRAFEASARRLSFTAAANELNRTQTSVSHQVRSLEAHIGFQLFERLPHGLRLTDMGLAYLPAVRKAFEDLSTATSGLFGPVSERPVIVRAPISWAVLWLAPRLSNFAAQYPEIDVRLYSAIWADSLSSDETDIDIRLGDGQWPGQSCELLCLETVIPVCAPHMLKSLTPFHDVSVLAEQNLIHIMGFEDLWMRLFRDQGHTIEPNRRGITVDTTLAAIELVASGNGFAMMMRSMAAKGISEDKLVQAAPVEFGIPQAHYVLLPNDASQTRPEVLLFKDWLLNQSSGSLR